MERPGHDERLRNLVRELVMGLEVHSHKGLGPVCTELGVSVPPTEARGDGDLTSGLTK